MVWDHRAKVRFLHFRLTGFARRRQKMEWRKATGSSSVWSEYPPWTRVVVGSNPTCLIQYGVKKILSKLFYDLPDKFVLHTNARLRRAINFWLLIAWLTVGSVLWFVLMNVLWFIGFMSLYALWATHFGGFSAETPVEAEDTNDKSET